MPNFVTDVYSAFLQLLEDSRQIWATTPVANRLLIALALAGVGVYLGSRSERIGTSALLYFLAFGFFAYVVAVGITLVK